MEAFIDWELAAMVLSALACMAAYQVKTGGAWHSTEHGRHVMAFTAMGAVLVAISLLMSLAGLEPNGPAWLTVVRLVGYTLVLPVFPWRLWLIMTAVPDDAQPSPWRVR